jgi:hypothetical protein
MSQWTQFWHKTGTRIFRYIYLFTNIRNYVVTKKILNAQIDVSQIKKQMNEEKITGR